jgi:osmotically-inducible protein OsmY
MVSSEDVVERVRHVLRSEQRIDLHRTPIDVRIEDGMVTLEGDVADIAAKKLALERIAALPGVAGIVDRLHVQPASPMEDGEIRDALRNALLEEPALANIALHEEVKGEWVAVRLPADGAAGEIRASVSNGIVTLAGDVPGLVLKRLAGVLAWWIPGSRDVVNGIAVTPAEEDSDAEITEAVRVALEKDPFVNASQIRVRTRNSVVTLEGLVPSEAEREMAEFDAWYVFAVDRVINRIVVRD